MPVVSRVTTIVLTNAGATRTFRATADVQDQAAGGLVTITVTQVTAGAVGLPPVPDTYTLRVRADNDAANIRSYTLTAGAGSQVVTFNLTADGTSGGAARIGTVRMRLEAVKTSGSAVDNYNVNSDDATGQVLPAAWTITRDQGWFRTLTTAVVTISNVAAGGAKPATWAYDDTVFHRVTFPVQSYLAKSLTAIVSGASPALSAASPSVVGPVWDTTLAGVIDNRFPASMSNQTADVTIPNATLATGLPYVAATVTPDSMDIDPRLTAVHHLQLNDNVFATPPGSRDIPGHDRLNADLGFAAFRLLNARGAGANGVTVTETLRDAGELIGVLTRSVATVTQGGEAGWAATFQPWDSQLPGGAWNHTLTVTAPADMIGVAYLLNATDPDFTLLAANPSIGIVVSGGPTDRARHWTAGQSFQIGIAAVNAVLAKLLVVDNAFVAVVRLQNVGANAGRAEFLDSDMVWKRLDIAASLYFWPALETIPGVSRVYIKTFTDVQTADWSDYDLFAIGKAVISGVTYSLTSKEIVVGAANDHGGYGVDPVGLALSGAIGMR